MRLLLVLSVLALALAAPARAEPVATPKCTIPPSAVAMNCSSWFASDVLVHWNVSAGATACEDRLITADTTGTTVSCTTSDESGSMTFEVVIKRDATPPDVGAGHAARGADDNGWYTQPVTIDFAGADATSGIGECSAVTYDGPDTSAGSVVGTCTDVAGNLGSSPPFHLKYDATGPEVTAAVPERPPDHAGWYTAPVTFGFLGADATSGLAACTSARYAGPDSAAASVLGTCQDNAGNVGSRTFGLKFDATPPPVTGLRAVPGDRRVALRWSTAPDVTFVEVLRIPGVGSKPASVVFDGPGSSFVDDAVANGVSYVYRVRVRDAAGNEGNDAIGAVPRLPAADPPPGTGTPLPGPAPEVRPRGARLRFPRANAVISARRPPLLRWTRVRHARYYNLQLHRGGRKVLSAWPTRPRYRLQRRWSYGGKLRHLTRGRYVWYVWPGFGRRSAARYGDLLGRRAFRVR